MYIQKSQYRLCLVLHLFYTYGIHTNTCKYFGAWQFRQLYAWPMAIFEMFNHFNDSKFPVMKLVLFIVIKNVVQHLI